MAVRIKHAANGLVVDAEPPVELFKAPSAADTGQHRHSQLGGPKEAGVS
jgi:hypothetical protein